MTTLHSLEIKNFRGIKEYSQTFFDNDFVCLIGRGDSGKSTILEAMSILFSPNWNISFYDSDFYNCDTSQNIEIIATLINLPLYLIKENKFGLFIRGFEKSTGEILDDLTDESTPALTVKFMVANDLEPNWTIINSRQEPLRFNSSDRARLNVFLISDYTDRHFSWNKGNPLYSLLKQNDADDSENKKNVILDALRQAKNKIDESSFENLESTIEQIKSLAADLGIDISDTKTSIDFKDIFVKENKVCLHDEHVPFRLKGKGSKRLISISIQSALAKSGGIILIDEIEQGLEPDRVKHLVRTLCIKNEGQIFVTTHSQNVIEELDTKNIILIQNEKGIIKGVPIPEDDKFQSLMRTCPEAIYAKKVIVCEGKTEIGVCRALDFYRIHSGKLNMAAKDVVYTTGEGSSFPLRALKLKELGLKVCVFCDSDNDEQLSPSKKELIAKEIQIFDWDSGNSIEKQIFTDLHWDGIKALIEYRIKEKDGNIDSVKSSIKAHYDGVFPDNWQEQDTLQMRTAIALASLNKGNEWFKRIAHGEFLGNKIYEYYDSMYEKSLKSKLDNLSAWIDND